MWKQSISYIILLFSLAWGQVVPQAGNMKLLAYDQKDQAVTDAVQIGSSLFFAVPFLDSATAEYPAKYFQIVKTDSSGNVLDKITINPDTLRSLYIEKLFPIRHPVTLELCVGMLGVAVKIDTITNDTSGYVFGGWIFQDFSAHAISYTLQEEIDTASIIPALYPLFAKQTEVIQDTLLALFMDRDSDSLKYLLASFSMDITGLTLLDTLTLHSENMFSVNALRVHPTFYKTLHKKGLRVIYADKYALIRNFDVISFSPLQLDTLPNIVNFMYIPTNLTLYEYYATGISDTSFSYGIGSYQGEFYHYLWKWSNTSGNISLQDSFRIEVSNQTGVDAFGKPFSIAFPYVYVVISENSWEYLANVFSWDFSWMHDTMLTGQGNNYFTVHLFEVNNFQKIASVSLGGDAYYGVHGIIAPSDSVCIVYGWRFPLGDLTRIDGDAFIWKITWDGLVTPILGEAPKYAFKIFPNPAKDILKISGKTKEATTFLLRSTDGKEVLPQKFPAGQEDWELDVSQIPRGIYLLEILTEGGARFTEKVMLE